MAKRKYVVTSPEGAGWAGVEEGETIERELSEETELALVAAGWLAHEKKKEAGK